MYIYYLCVIVFSFRVDKDRSRYLSSRGDHECNRPRKMYRIIEINEG